MEEGQGQPQEGAVGHTGTQPWRGPCPASPGEGDAPGRGSREKPVGAVPGVAEAMGKAPTVRKLPQVLTVRTMASLIQETRHGYVSLPASSNSLRRR